MNFLSRLIKRPLALPIFLIVVILLIAAGLAIILVGNKQSLFNDSKIKFLSKSSEFRYKELIDKALSAKSSQERDKILASAFLVVSSDYDSDPTPDKRQLLSEIHAYLKKTSPDLVASQRLYVPCREEACGAKFEYTDKLLEMKNSIMVLDTEQFVKDALLHNLENASLLNGKGNNEGVFNSLRVNFEILKEEWKRGKSEKIKKLSESVTSELKRLDKEKFEEDSKRGYYLLDK